jgi:hypothetical protein
LEAKPLSFKAIAAILRVPLLPHEVSKTRHIGTLNELDQMLLREFKRPELQQVVRDSSKHLENSLQSALELGEIRKESLRRSLYRLLMRLSSRANPLALTTSVNAIRFEATTQFKQSSEVREIRHLLPPSFIWPIRVNDDLVFRGESLFLSQVSSEGKFERRQVKLSGLARDILSLLKDPLPPQQLLDLLQSKDVTLERAHSVVGELIEKGVLIQKCGEELLPVECLSGQLDSGAPHDKILTRDLSEMTVGQSELEQMQITLELVLQLMGGRSFRSPAQQALKRFSDELYELHDCRWVPLVEALDLDFGIPFKPKPLAGPSAVDSYFKAKLAELRMRGEEVWQLQDAEVSEMLKLSQSESDVSMGYCVFGTPLVKDKRNKFFFRNARAGFATLGLSRFNAFDLVEDKVMEAELKKLPMHRRAVYAELGFTSSAQAEKLRRRKCFFEHVITCNHSVLPQGKTAIPLGDLLVRSHKGQIELYSKKLDRFVIPILNHMHNFMVDARPTFRMLCALALQGAPEDVHWAWPRDMKSGFLPRVEYRDLILFPRCWVLEKKVFIEAIVQGDLQGRFGLPNEFILVVYGNAIPVTASRPELLKSLLSNHPGEDVVIYEDLSLDHELPCQIAGKAYAAEWSVAFSPQSYQLPRWSFDAPVRLDATVKATGDDFISLHLVTFDPIRLEVVEEFLKRAQGFFVFFPLEFGRMEVRLRMADHGVGKEKLLLLLNLAADMKRRGEILSYAVTDYSDDSALLSGDDVHALEKLHVLHSKMMCEKDVKRRMCLTVSLLKEVRARLSLTGPDEENESPAEPVARYIKKIKKWQYELALGNQIEPSTQLMNLEQVSSRGLFFNRFVHFCALRLDPRELPHLQTALRWFSDQDH